MRDGERVAVMLRLMDVRSFVAVLASATALAACSTGGATGGGASCVDSLQFAGGAYSGHVARIPAERLRESLTGAVRPACNDHSGSNDRDEPILVRRLDGVDPAVAVSGDNTASVYVRDGTDVTRLPPWLRIAGEPSPAG